jgi:hypothetical protein
MSEWSDHQHFNEISSLFQAATWTNQGDAYRHTEWFRANLRMALAWFFQSFKRLPLPDRKAPGSSRNLVRGGSGE